MNKEKWINEILQSAKGIQPVASNPYMATRIEARLQEAPAVNKISVRWVFVSTAVMLLVLALNIAIWNSSARTNKISDLQQLVNEYGFTSNDFYSTNYPK
jgi:hypothetical protein